MIYNYTSSETKLGDLTDFRLGVGLSKFAEII